MDVFIYIKLGPSCATSYPTPTHGQGLTVAGNSATLVAKVGRDLRIAEEETFCTSLAAPYVKRIELAVIRG